MAPDVCFQPCSLCHGDPSIDAIREPVASGVSHLSVTATRPLHVSRLEKEMPEKIALGHVLER